MERVENTERFYEQLKRFEGLRLKAYLCPAGKLTIGYGHNCEVWPVAGVRKVGDGIKRTQAEELLVEDVCFFAEKLDEKIPWWRGLSEPRQAVVLGMAFQLGVSGLLGFRKAMAAMERGDYEDAAREMLDSKWARKDSPLRASELVLQMHEGEWQEDV